MYIYIAFTFTNQPGMLVKHYVFRVTKLLLLLWKLFVNEVFDAYMHVSVGIMGYGNSKH